MRVRTLSERGTYTVDRLVGKKTGLIKDVTFTSRSRDTGDVVIARVNPRLDASDLGLTKTSSDFAAVGKGTTKEAALKTAVGEYVERYCAFTGITDAAKRRTSYRTMDARHPKVPSFEVLTQYTDRQYEKMNADALTCEMPVTWVVGTSLLTGEKAALPAWLSSSIIESPHGFTSSNGCATGQSLAGAAYRGLLEYIERDALMRCWYSRDSPDRIQLAAYPELRRLRNRCKPAGGEVELISIDTDLPFETVGAAFVGAATNRPKFLLAASSRLSFSQAVTDALVELTQVVETFRHHRLLDEGTAPEDGIPSLGQNWLFYAEPANFEGVERLVDGETVTPAQPDADAKDPTSATERLRVAIDSVDSTGMEPIIYELTNPDIRYAGLRVVKVVIPELVPLCHPERPAAAHPRLPEDAVSCGPHPVG